MYIFHVISAVITFKKLHHAVITVFSQAIRVRYSFDNLIFCSSKCLTLDKKDLLKLPFTYYILSILKIKFCWKNPSQFVFLLYYNEVQLTLQGQNTIINLQMHQCCRYQRSTNIGYRKQEV